MANIFTSNKIKGKRWQVYALCDPTTQEIKYIGVTHSTLYQRLCEHLSDVKREFTPKSSWIKGLLIEGSKPIIKPLCDGNGGDWKSQELAYIEKYRAIGGLLNVQPSCLVER